MFIHIEIGWPMDDLMGVSGAATPGENNKKWKCLSAILIAFCAASLAQGRHIHGDDVS